MSQQQQLVDDCGRSGPPIDASAGFDLVIEAGRPERHYWMDLWRFRELFYFLAWRDILVRYKQTAIGIAWALIRPLLTMVVFTVVFGRLAKLPSYGVPYPLLVLCGLLPWQFFSASLSDSSNSLIVNTNLISKIYFPRMVIPVSAVVTSLVDLAISAAFLFGMMLWYGAIPGRTLLMLPFFGLLAFAGAMGAGVWLAALTVKYRDFRYVVPFIAQFGLYISPVGFSSSIIPESWRLLYYLNPMAGVIDGFRWALLKGAPIFWPGVFISSLVVFLLVVSGATYFRRTERAFADVI